MFSVGAISAWGRATIAASVAAVCGVSGCGRLGYGVSPRLDGSTDVGSASERVDDAAGDVDSHDGVDAELILDADDAALRDATDAFDAFDVSDVSFDALDMSDASLDVLDALDVSNDPADAVALPDVEDAPDASCVCPGVFGCDLLARCREGGRVVRARGTAAPGGNIAPIAVGIDAARNVRVTYVYLGPATIEGVVMPGADASSIAISRLDARGVPLSTRGYPVNAPGFFPAITATTTPLGETWVIGHQVSGPIDLGLGSIALSGTFPSVIAKYDAATAPVLSRQILWATTALRVASMTSPDVFGQTWVAGYYAGTIHMDSTSSTGPLLQRGFAVGYDDSSTLRRAFVLPGARSAVSTITTDQRGDVWVAGTHRGANDFGGGTLPTFGGGDVFVARFTSAFAHASSSSYGGAGDDDADRIYIDPSDNVWVSGLYRSGIAFGATSHPSTATIDAFITRFDIAGAPQYSRALASTGVDRIIALSGDATGNIWVLGSTTGMLDVGGMTVGAPPSALSFVASYFPDGTLRFVRTLGTTVRATQLALASDDSVWIAGRLDAVTDFGTGPLDPALDGPTFLLELHD